MKLRAFCLSFISALGLSSFLLIVSLFALQDLSARQISIPFVPLPVLSWICWVFMMASVRIYLQDTDKEQKIRMSSYASYMLLNTLIFIVASQVLSSIIPRFSALLTSSVFSYVYYALFLSSVVQNTFLNTRISTSGEDTNKKSIAVPIILFIITGLALGLRLYKLDHLTPYIDEFYHLLGAKRFLLEGTFNYPRAPFLTGLIGLIFKIHGTTSLYFARLPSALIGSLTVIPIYFLGKKLNRYIGIIAALLFAVAPVSIGISRSIREYPFFFFVLVIFLNWSIWTIKKLQNNYRDIAGIINAFAILMLPALYFIFLDVSNFVIQIYIILFVFFVVFQTHHLISSNKVAGLYNVVRQLTAKYYLRIILIGLLIIGILALLISRVSWVLNFSLPANIFQLEANNYFSALFDPYFSPWGEKLLWFSGSSYPTFFIFSFFLLSSLLFIKRKAYLAYLGSFAFILITFLYFTDRYYAIRYISYALPFYIVLFAGSVYTLLSLKKIYIKRSTRITYIFLISILLVSIFNPLPAIEGLKNEQIATVDPKTEMLGYNYPELFRLLSELRFKDGDFIVTSEGLKEPLAYYFNNYNFLESIESQPLMRIESHTNGELIYDYSTIVGYYTASPYYARPCLDRVCNMEEKDRIGEIISNQQHGWIIIDKDRNRNWTKNGFPLANFLVRQTNVQFRGSTDGYRGFDVYSW